MFRRQFLKNSALLGAGVAAGAPGFFSARAQQAGATRIIMAGYGPSTTSFSRGLDFIGERLEARFGDAVDPRYIYNIYDVGYGGAGDLRWLVDSGVLTLAYSTMSTGIPELEVAALPFLFPDTASARAAMAGPPRSRAASEMAAERVPPALSPQRAMRAASMA